MASRQSSSEGEIVDEQHKANSISQPDECTIDDSFRAFGLDGASDEHGAYSNHRAPRQTMLTGQGRNYRPVPSRSPSPYHARRDTRRVSRSPSPFRHGRDSDSRAYNKRKASPPRGYHPDKRQNLDHNRHSPPRGYHPDRRQHIGHSKHNFLPTSRHGNARTGPRQDIDRRPTQPLSYADNDHAPTVPDFNEHVRPLEKSRQNGSSSRARDRVPRADTQNGNAPNVPQTSTSNSNGSSNMPKPQEDTDLPVEPVIQELSPTQEELDKRREERRRKWAAKRAADKMGTAKDNLLHQTLVANASESTTPNVASPVAFESPVSPADSPRIGDLGSVPVSPDVMCIDKKGITTQGNSPSVNSPSDADYDPKKDTLDDRDRAARKARQTEMPSGTYNETDPKVLSTLPAGKVDLLKKQAKNYDMFDFSDEAIDAEIVSVEKMAGTTKGTVLAEKLLDNWDDAEGFYKLIANELVDGGRYRMIKNLGRGVYANVAQAEDISIESETSKNKLVAIKMCRRNDRMRGATQKEVETIRKLNDADPQDKRHIIRSLGSFDHKGHLCAVFEHMSKNLRDLLKEDAGHGVTLPAIKSFSRQMFVALQYLQTHQIVHCDLKPDNILVSLDLKVIKICDFGTAVDRRDIEANPEIASRFYRAPEIILGLELGYGIDMWAIGCTIYELWTGKILFTGGSNNEMIKTFMNCLGWPTEKLLKKGNLQNVLEHFEAGPPLKFISQEVDERTKQVTIRKIVQQKKIPRDLKSRINDATRGITKDNVPPEKELNDFVDLLGACLNFNPEKRMQPKDALSHKFFPQPRMVPRPNAVKPPMVKRPVSTFRR